MATATTNAHHPTTNTFRRDRQHRETKYVSLFALVQHHPPDYSACSTPSLKLAIKTRSTHDNHDEREEEIEDRISSSTFIAVLSYSINRALSRSKPWLCSCNHSNHSHPILAVSKLQHRSSSLTQSPFKATDVDVCCSWSPHIDLMSQYYCSTSSSV